MLNIQNVSITYGNNLTPTVEGVTLDVKQGEIVSIVGESGSGKTTVIRAVLGCLPGGGRVSRGNILYEGKSLLKKTEQDLAREDAIYTDTEARLKALAAKNLSDEEADKERL